MYDLNSASNLESILFADDMNLFISDLFNKTYLRLIYQNFPKNSNFTKTV